LWGGFTVTAEIDSIGAETDGVVCAMGDRFGGYALYVVQGVPMFTFARAADSLHVSGKAPLGPGRRTIAVTFTVGHDADGRMELFVDDQSTDHIAVTGMLPMALQHGGAGLRVGYDSGFAVTSRYTPPATFSGTVHFMRIETPAARAPRPADDVRAALHSD
jgi:arylsulfatase